MAPSPGGTQPPLAWAQIPPEQAEVRLIGPQRVLVKDLPAEPNVLPQGEEVRAIRRLAPDIGVRATYGGAPQAAEANVLDSAARQGLEANAPPGLSTNFEGLDDNDDLAVIGFTITPPDPQIAVGPDHVVEFVNIVGRITNKSGVPAVADFSLASFFDVPPGSSDFDPKIIYDDIHDRFFASYVSIDSFGNGFLRLAISETSNPTGMWNVYFVGPYVGVFPDYPGIGVTNDKFTISYNLYPTSAGNFIGEQTMVLEKAHVMAGLPDASIGVFFFPVNAFRFTVRPAHSLSAVNDQYLTTWNLFSSNQLTVIRITGTPNASNVAEASATNVTTLLQDSPPPSVTAGAGDCIVRNANFGPPPCINSGDFRVLEAIWRDNSLWSSASAACIPPSDGAVRSCAHLIEVETVGTPAVVQDIMFGASGEYFSWPAIRTDSAGNLYVSLTHSDPSIFAEARVVGRCAFDPLNTMSGSSVLRTGEIVHLTGRWGDYLGAAVDPSDPSSVWVLGQYAKNTGGPYTSWGYWGTYVAKTSYDACPVCPPLSPGSTFCDVAPDNWAWAYIEALFDAGITSGCAIDPLRYCPSDPVTRAQMAVFIILALNQTPVDSPIGVFDDVPPSHWAAGFIEKLAQLGITSGCSVSSPLYCPNDPITRAQMAVFIISSLEEAPVESPIGVFDDVPPSHWAAGFIERLHDLGITSGCSLSPPLYCPNAPLTRAQMAVFIVVAWELLLSNDNFVDAIVIPEPLPYTNAQNTIGTTTEGGEPSPCGGIASTVWYRHTPTTSGVLTADTFGSGYDTVLAVYTGPSVGSLTLVGCNDDTGSLQSEVAFSANAGTTYHFQVGGYFGDTGNLVFNLAGGAPSACGLDANALAATIAAPGVAVLSATCTGSAFQFCDSLPPLQGFPTDGTTYLAISSGDCSPISVGASPAASEGRDGREVDPANHQPMDLATLSVTIAVPPGATTLSFDWKFGTNEGFLGIYQDFFTADGLLATVDSTFPISSCPPVPPDVNFQCFVTNVQTHSIDVTGLSQYTVTFQVGDDLDTAFDSAAFIDNLTFGVVP